MVRLAAVLLSALLVTSVARAADGARLDPVIVSTTLARAAALPRLHALIVARDGVPVVERVFRGPNLDRPVNIKSASKTILDALIGIAIERGVLKNASQPILPLLRSRAPAALDPKVGAITLDHLMSMRSGLERTSGLQNYGRWVKSPNWVSFALSRPFLAEPGETFLYSTGNTHLLSAILTDAAGKSTWELAREWLGKPLAIDIPQWTRDPQGVYFGGNEMALSPRALFKFGEMYRNGGVYEGKRVLPESWVRASWTPQGSDRRGNGYGYGWFIASAYGHPVYFGWGFGGQMLYVIPDLAMTVVMTSDSNTRSVDDGYICDLHDMVANGFMPAAMGTERLALFPAANVCGVPSNLFRP
jgi:CubicO group peptidase (beta-lactamase class C family)